MLVADTVWMPRIPQVGLRALLPLLLVLPAFAQDKLVKDALRVIAKYEALEPSLAPGDVATAKRYINGLGRAGKRLNAAYKKNTVHWKAAAKRYQALVEKIRARAKGAKPQPAKQPAPGKEVASTRAVDARALDALNSKVRRMAHNMRSIRISELQDAKRVQRLREQIVGFRAQLKGLPAKDRRVATVAKNITAMEKMLEGGLAKLEALRAPKGAAERLAQLREFYGGFKMLRPLQAPLEAKSVGRWAQQLRAVQERLPADLAFLDSLRGKVGIDGKLLQRVRGWVASTWPLKIRGLHEQNQNTIYAPVRTAEMFLKAILEIDPTNKHHVTNRVLGEGQLDRKVRQLRESKLAIDVAAAYDDGIARKDAPDYAGMKARVDKAIAHMQSCAKQGLASVRMPKSATKDKELLAIAGKVLAREKYGAGKSLRTVINAPKKRKEKHEGSITPGTVSATIRVYHYVWDEFQVATVERVGEQCWIFYNRMRFYHKGGSTTPTGHWILADRFRSTPILEANIGK